MEENALSKGVSDITNGLTSASVRVGSKEGYVIVSRKNKLYFLSCGEYRSLLFLYLTAVVLTNVPKQLY